MKFHFFSSAWFWIALALTVVLSRLLVRAGSSRTVFLTIASALIILAIPGFTPAHLGLLSAIGLFTYAVGVFLSRPAGAVSVPARKLAAALGISVTLGFLAFFKYRFVQALFLKSLAATEASASRLVFMVGVSYFSFKMIHFIIESYRRRIAPSSALTYSCYVLFFASFMSGPINRFEPFSRSVETHLSTTFKADFVAGGERIVHGLFKKFVLVQIVHPYVLGTSVTDLPGIRSGTILVGLYAYALYFYFDFSGYSDLAIGSARLLGIELPENFNNPFIQKNIRELWTNWHMSLTSWLVDYVYWPLVRTLREFEPLRKRPIFLSNICMFITFVLCGMWHGEGFHFLVWGAYHGLGISALTVYQRQKRRIGHPKIVRYFRSRTSRVVGTILTFNYFALGLAFFVLDLKDLGRLLAGLL